MKKVFLEQFSNALKAVLPINILVLILSICFMNTSLPNLLPSFLIGSILLVIGMCLFNIGSDISMLEIGSKIGTHLTRKKNILLILIASFIIGFIITIAEPI